MAPSSATADIVRVRAIQLIDDRGQVRARLNVEPGGEVVFRLLDEEGTIRVKLGASEDGSRLLLLNDLTELGVHLLTDQNGSQITLSGRDGTQQVIEP